MFINHESNSVRRAEESANVYDVNENHSLEIIKNQFRSNYIR